MMEPCGHCRHPWAEYLLALPEARDLGGCGECVYEVDHGERESSLICTLTVPTDVLDRADAAAATA